MDNIKSLLLGWAFGIASPLIAEFLKKPFQRASLKKVFFSELIGMRFRLANNVFLISERIGELDKDILNLLHGVFANSPGVEAKKQREAVSGMLIKGEEGLKALSAMTKAKIDNEELVPLSLKKLTLPFIDRQMNNLYLFEAEFQYRLLEIRSIIDTINQSIDLSQFYYQKSFDSSLNEVNHRILFQNTVSTYRDLHKQAQRVITQINDFMEQFGRATFFKRAIAKLRSKLKLQM